MLESNEQKPQSPAAFWCLAPRVALHWRRWGDEWVVFDQGSCETLLTDTLTSMTLMAMESAPNMSPPDICDWVAAELEISEPADLADRIVDILKSLHKQGLVDSIQA